MRATRAAGHCSGGSEPPPGASSAARSDGAPISSSRGTPTIRSDRLVGVEDDALRVPDEDALLERGRQRDRGREAHRPGAHPVPDAADRADEVRGARVIGELAAQVGDVDVDQVVVAEPVRAPHALEQLRAAERDARLGGERVEQVELDPGQLERRAVER